MNNLGTQIQPLKTPYNVTLKETTKCYNLGQNKRFKMRIRAMGLLLLVTDLYL